ncbi:hypothetical protein [Snuella sedimenti]|uniref:Tetratricopeptide repeat protein n=1 Tax=Snuella sedimenti TaxID=2798802 RepID=A0A8J7LNK5_9FLAO|nr:hypothetical protein [Snuella sedimenti]MBJ6368053.1 hypothetical protein [Snuella sedimenti]
MNNTDFTYLLQQPQTAAEQQTEALKSIIDEFPYFQSARAIYLKCLKNTESFKYNQELKTTAAYTTDRSILFDFITSEIFIQNEVSNFIKQGVERIKDIDVDVEDISVDKKVSLDDTLRQQIKETTGVLDPALFQPKVPRPTLLEDISPSVEPTSENTPSQDATASKVLKLGSPLQFNKNESHSFNEWLKLTRYKPIQRSEENSNKTVNQTPSSQLEKAKKFELIDKFISKNPKINPTKTSPPKGNLAKAQMIQPEALMTETLARIYLEQKNYKKAIQSYKILSLKYPEKSSFFAIQIKAVEQLQEQNNKEQ